MIYPDNGRAPALSREIVGEQQVHAGFVAFWAKLFSQAAFRRCIFSLTFKSN